LGILRKGVKKRCGQIRGKEAGEKEKKGNHCRRASKKTKSNQQKKRRKGSWGDLIGGRDIGGKGIKGKKRPNKEGSTKGRGSQV